MEQWLKFQGDNDVNTKPHQEGNTANAFNDFIEKRAATIPAEPISEQEIHLNLQPTSNQNQSNV